MKKTFPFKIDNKAPERQVDSIKYEIKKYLKRERGKKLPEGVDFWDFDCKVGPSLEEAEVIHPAEINKGISQVFEAGSEQIYIEILAKKGIRTKKPKED